ncbi:hypothetical protein BDY19DRAFT_960772 [Irpex rosettiformis]|uniref:Uncharacterized protein n=1 Tax=Irpex rosettiformis TaxID=378272 RepID=A0ACB8TW64_9APHY|nr:hypothetical protein BDY19DRAFT_960772 [Irpex rosettiformis]
MWHRNLANPWLTSLLLPMSLAEKASSPVVTANTAVPLVSYNIGGCGGHISTGYLSGCRVSPQAALPSQKRRQLLQETFSDSSFAISSISAPSTLDVLQW